MCPPRRSSKTPDDRRQSDSWSSPLQKIEAILPVPILEINLFGADSATPILQHFGEISLQSVIGYGPALGVPTPTPTTTLREP
jgi:hypothetical protein